MFIYFEGTLLMLRIIQITISISYIGIGYFRSAWDQSIPVFPGAKCSCISWTKVFLYFLDQSVPVFPGPKCSCISWTKVFLYFLE